MSFCSSLSIFLAVLACLHCYLLGVHSAILHFPYFLEGQEFTVFTDHNPIVSAMKKKTELKSGRQTRHLATISEFTTDIQHIDGKDVEQEDTMPSFMFDTVNTVQPGLYYQAMSLAQQSDPDVQAYRTAIKSLRLEDVPFSSGSFTLLCDVSTGTPRPVVPESWRRLVFDTVHSLSHPGARTTKCLVSSKFIWHGLGKQITEWARSCVPC